MSNINNTVVSTRIRLARNINNLPFPNRLSGEEAIYSTLLAGVQKSCDALFTSKCYAMKSIDTYLSESLVERHLISRNLQTSKYGAVFISDSEDISIMVNEEDHLRVQSLMNGYNLEGAYNNVAKVDAQLKKNLDIAFDKHLGYLTSCPTNLGSAMRASVMLFLPALTMTGLIESLIMKFQQYGITTRGVYGEGSQAEGYMYQVSNQAAISLSENDILKKVKRAVDTLVEAEETARVTLAKQRGLDLKNDIMISYGILKYACKISSQELMQNLAMVKLGVALGYINSDIDKLNNLMVITQPGMLCFLAKAKLSPVQRDVNRAEIVKKILG